MPVSCPVPEAARPAASPAPPAASDRAAWPGDLLLGTVVALSRVPFLRAGYGSDTDTWKVARAAHDIARTGHYETSRLPGYPVQEYACALLWRGGPLALNALTALFSAAAAVLFARLWRACRGRDARLAALAFAFVPAVYVSSTATIDYLWALAFVLGAFVAARSGRALASGVLLGVAVGCRITSACFVLPLAFVLTDVVPHRRARAIAVLATVATVLGAACYLPVYQRYGAGFLSYYEPYSGQSHGIGTFFSGLLHPGPPPFPPALIAGQATVLVWGLIGTLALVVAWATAWRDRHAPDAVRAMPRPSRATAFAWAASIALIAILYVRLPHDEGYLIPAVPFVLLATAAVTTRRVFRALAVALLIAPFVLGVDIEPPKKGLTPAVRSPWVLRRERAAGQAFVLDALRGPVIQDLDKRVRTVQVLDATLARWPALPPRARVIVGMIAPALLDTIPLVPADPRYFNTLPRERLARYLAAGDPVYYLPDTRVRTLRAEGYDPAALGARPMLPTSPHGGAPLQP